MEPERGGNGNEVDSIAVQPDGKILVGGNFSGIGGETRTALPGSMQRPAWPIRGTLTRSSQVYTIAVQPDGKIVVGGGFFGNIGGQIRNRIARLDPVTGAADSFNPNCERLLSIAIVVQADGKILAGRQVQQHRRTSAQQHRPARRRHRIGRFVRPEHKRSLACVYQWRCKRTGRF